jgi:hypothetical protein
MSLAHAYCPPEADVVRIAVPEMSRQQESLNRNDWDRKPILTFVQLYVYRDIVLYVLPLSLEPAAHNHFLLRIKRDRIFPMSM